MHIRDDFSECVLHIINTPQMIPQWHVVMLSVLLQLSQHWQYVVSCVSLTTSTTEQWGKNEFDTCCHPNGVFMVPIRLFGFAMLVWLNSLEVEHTDDIIQ